MQRSSASISAGTFTARASPIRLVRRAFDHSTIRARDANHMTCVRAGPGLGIVPSSALIKAALINSGQAIGGTVLADKDHPTQQIPVTPVPSILQGALVLAKFKSSDMSASPSACCCPGFGRIQLDRTLRVPFAQTNAEYSQVDAEFCDLCVDLCVASLHSTCLCTMAIQWMLRPRESQCSSCATSAFAHPVSSVACC